jgi:acylglycerol lipase
MQHDTAPAEHSARAHGMTRLLALLACLLPGACAVLQSAPHPTSFDTPIPASLVFTMPDGAALPARDWLPPAGAPWRGVILALHGFTDSRDGWELPAPVFAAAGYAVFAPDQRGFGGTADRGGWAGTQRLTADVAVLMAQLRARYPGEKLILMGESMGGAVAAMVAARPGAGPDATVLLAPAVWGPGQMDPALFATLVLADAVALGQRQYPRPDPVRPRPAHPAPGLGAGHARPGDAHGPGA